MGSKKRPYSKEFKVEAVKLAEQLGSRAKAARQLGVSASSVWKWQNECQLLGQDAFPGKGRLVPQDQLIRDLERKVKRLELEKEVLKKAIGYFSEAN